MAELTGRLSSIGYEAGVSLCGRFTLVTDEGDPEALPARPLSQTLVKCDVAALQLIQWAADRGSLVRVDTGKTTDTASKISTL